jgi:competence protein ComEC
MKQYTYLCVLAVCAFIGMAVWQYAKFHDGKLHVIFCNVGQGDAILIKPPNNTYILVDGGPDKRVLDCLSRHMPFWERELSLVLLSHPHADHFMGMYYLLERYRFTYFATEKLSNKTPAFTEYIRLLGEYHIPKQFVWIDDGWNIGNMHLTVVSPTEQFIEQTSPGGTIGESGEFASLILHVSYGSFDLVLTGDSQARELREAADRIGKPIDVLQSPHHGSATGLDDQVLRQLSPKLAVISVGKNRYGHPTKFVLDLYKTYGIKVLRTDNGGDVEIVSDGNTWWITRSH